MRDTKTKGEVVSQCCLCICLIDLMNNVLYLFLLYCRYLDLGYSC
jgi:hypothetical protein